MSVLRTLALLLVPLAAAMLGLTWAFDGRGPGVSLLGGAFPRLVEVAAAAGWLTAVARPGRRWWRVTLPVLSGVTVLVVGGTALALHWTGTVNDHYPPSFAVWVGAVVLAALVCPFRLRERDGRGRRRATGLVAVMAVPLTAAAAFLLINSHYGYWPTLGDLVGHSLAGQISSGQLAAALGATGDGSTSGAALPGGAAAAPPPSEGKLAPLDIPATVSGFAHMAGSVYLPPVFFTGRRHLPVVVMLAGVPNSPAAWPHAGFATATADAFAAAHHGLAPILVFVDENGSITGDSECVDGPKGRAETYLAVDVPRYVTKTFGASTSPSDWAVAGFSEGGTCALDLALRHPDVYGRFVDMAGDPAPTLGDTARTLSGLYGGDKAAMAAHDAATLLRRQRYPRTTGWFVVGTDDASHRQPGDDLSSPAHAAGITVHSLTIDGGHNWQFASKAFRQILPELAGTLGIGGPAGTIAAPKGDGYWLVTSDGRVLPYGDARFFGDPQGKLDGRTVVGMAGTPSGDGYWVLASDGTLFPFGDAPDVGSPRLAPPDGGSSPGPAMAVAAATTASGRGVWVVTGDGRVLPRGDAPDLGSLTGPRLNGPVAGLATTPTGKGYWLAAADGGVFAFGDAAFGGSLAGTPLTSPVVGIAAMPTGEGYWLVTADGKVHPFMARQPDGDGAGAGPGRSGFGGTPFGGSRSAGFAGRAGPGPGPGSGFGRGGRFGAGSAATLPMNRPVVGIGALSTDTGWWLAGADGGVFSFGEARFFGSAATTPLGAPVVGIATLLEE